MAERYGMLPHEVAERATTYDLMISDVLATYDRYTEAKSKGGTLDPNIYQFNQDELQKMVQKN